MAIGLYLFLDGVEGIHRYASGQLTYEVTLEINGTGQANVTTSFAGGDEQASARICRFNDRT